MPRRLLLVASTRSHAVNFHLPYLQEFARRGWEVDVACGGDGQLIPYVGRFFSVPFQKSLFSLKNATACLKLNKLISVGGYDAIFCHTSLAAFYTRLAVLFMKERPRLCNTVHGYLFDDSSSVLRRMMLGLAEKITAPVTDLLLTMNNWDLRYAQSHRLGREVAQIPGMGVDFTRFDKADAEQASELRRTLGFSVDDFLIIYAAEFSARKSQATLITALSMLPDNTVLLLPGEGALRSKCEALAKKIGVKDRVIFPGQLAEVQLWYKMADAAASSSRSEGLPFNVMEAMYCGLPVAASSVKGHTDLIADNETGLLFKYGDAADCAAQILRLMSDEALRKRLGSAAGQAAIRYSLERVMPEVMGRYKSIL